MARKAMIGAVGFGKPCSENESRRGWRLVSVLGKHRVDLLTKAMNKEELPDNLFLIVDTGSGYDKINHDEIDWDAHKLYIERNTDGTRS